MHQSICTPSPNLHCATTGNLYLLQCRVLPHDPPQLRSPDVGQQQGLAYLRGMLQVGQHVSQDPLLLVQLVDGLGHPFHHRSVPLGLRGGTEGHPHTLGLAHHHAVALVDEDQVPFPFVAAAVGHLEVQGLGQQSGGRLVAVLAEVVAELELGQHEHHLWFAPFTLVPGQSLGVQMVSKMGITKEDCCCCCCWLVA